MAAKAKHTRESDEDRDRVSDESEDYDRPRYRGTDRYSVEEPRQLAGNIGRLAYAWAQAGTEMWMGATQVVGNLLMNITDQVFSSAPGFERGVRRVEVEEREREENYDEDEDDERRRRRRERRRPITTAVVNHVDQALRDSADVIARSADRFQRSYYSPRTREADIDEARERRRQAEDEERRARAKRRQAKEDEREAAHGKHRDTDVEETSGNEEA